MWLTPFWQILYCTMVLKFVDDLTNERRVNVFFRISCISLSLVLSSTRPLYRWTGSFKSPSNRKTRSAALMNQFTVQNQTIITYHFEHCLEGLQIVESSAFNGFPSPLRLQSSKFLIHRLPTFKGSIHVRGFTFSLHG